MSLVSVLLHKVDPSSKNLCCKYKQIFPYEAHKHHYLFIGHFKHDQAGCFDTLAMMGQWSEMARWRNGEKRIPHPASRIRNLLLLIYVVPLLMLKVLLEFPQNNAGEIPCNGYE